MKKLYLRLFILLMLMAGYGAESLMAQKRPFIIIYETARDGYSDGSVLLKNVLDRESGFSYFIQWERLNALGQVEATGETVFGWGNDSFLRAGNINYRLKIYGQDGVNVNGQVHNNVIQLKYEGYGGSIVKVEQWGNARFVVNKNQLQLSPLGYDSSNFHVTATDIPDWSLTTSFRYLFGRFPRFGSDALTHVPNMEHWDVRHITNFEGMLTNCRNFNQNLGNWKLNSIQPGPYNGLADVLKGTGLSCENLQLTLTGWMNNPALPGAGIHLGIQGMPVLNSVGNITVDNQPRHYNRRSQAAIDLLRARGWTVEGNGHSNS